MEMSVDLKEILTESELLEVGNLDFNSLEYLDNEEEKWLKERLVCFTGSEFDRLMGFEDKVNDFPDGAEAYVIEKFLEHETFFKKKNFYSESVDHGKEFEAEAVEEFQKKTGKVVSFWGKDQKFVKQGQYVGVTPDGLIEKDEGIETKCPDSKTHYDWLENLNADNFKKKLKKYYWQIQGSMYVTDRKRWYFVSYDPRFKKEEKRLFILVIERNDEDIQKLKKRLFTATKKLKERLARFI